MAQQIMKEERSLGDLFSELGSETSTLIRQEIALAQAELTRKATKIGKNIGFLVVGASIAFAAFQAILVALIIGLGILIGNFWLSALIVGIVVAIIAAVLIMSAVNALKKVDPVPHRTVETVKEDAKWLKNQVS